ncbi:DUF4062 domain-containing protein [Pseudomonas putida]|uniref:DUF4062 domain-containing protein n=1 Tax=Pseudomonas putida TaxID=303 RepID=UPI0009BFBA3C|nr:DUF4062 domain-containing protein [Pseudomonas putida]
MQKKFQAFISSTFTDLEEERKVVLESLINNGFIPSGMELFPASHLPQLDYIKAIIDSCDIYILIIGARYGSLAPSGLSYTEEEYNYAASQNKIILSFIHSNPDQFPYVKSETDQNKRTLLNSFRSRVLESKLCRMWSNQVELAGYVATAVHEAKSDPSIVGWVRGNTPISLEIQQQLQIAKFERLNIESELERLRASHEEVVSTMLSQFIDATTAATPAEYDAWEAGAIAIKQPEKLIGHIPHLGEIRIAHKDFILPALHGTNAKIVIIPSGIKVYKTNLGHSTLLYMNGFRVEGIIAEQYSDRRVV